MVLFFYGQRWNLDLGQVGIVLLFWLLVFVFSCTASRNLKQLDFKSKISYNKQKKICFVLKNDIKVIFLEIYNDFPLDKRIFNTISVIEKFISIEN